MNDEMLGKRICLGRPAPAVYAHAGQLGYLQLPKGTIVDVLLCHDDGRLADVLSGGRRLVMLVQDLQGSLELMSAPERDKAGQIGRSTKSDSEL
jgi:hypothetical protein